MDQTPSFLSSWLLQKHLYKAKIYWHNSLWKNNPRAQEPNTASLRGLPRFLHQLSCRLTTSYWGTVTNSLRKWIQLFPSLTIEWPQVRDLWPPVAPAAHTEDSQPIYCSGRAMAHPAGVTPSQWSGGRQCLCTASLYWYEVCRMSFAGLWRLMEKALLAKTAGTCESSASEASMLTWLHLSLVTTVTFPMK